MQFGCVADVQTMQRPRQIISRYFCLKDISIFLLLTVILVLSVLSGRFPQIKVLPCFVPFVIYFGLLRSRRYKFMDEYRHRLTRNFTAQRMQHVWSAWLLMVSSTVIILAHNSYYTWLAFFMIFSLAGLCLVAAARCNIYGSQ